MAKAKETLTSSKKASTKAKTGNTNSASLHGLLPYVEKKNEEYMNENHLEFAEGNAIKYICRHKLKGKSKDIEKAIHYLEMILERDYD